MKEIGEIFSEKRKEIGITIDEMSKDLKIDKLLIENLEEGNIKAFKDIVELKDVITSLSKYLGLDGESIIDDLNDYLFEKTSKISVDDIKSVYSKEKEERKIKSPYTIETIEKKNKIKFTIIVILVLIILVMLYFLLRNILVG